MEIEKVEKIGLSKEYINLFKELKKKISTAQIRAARAANKELIRLYWNIGSEILKLQQEAKWGSKFIEKLSKDLQSEFPGMKGFSVSNLKKMKIFAELHQEPISSQVVNQLPWGHIVILLLKVKNRPERDWYINKALEYGWSRSILEIQIEQQLYERQGIAGKKTSNFKNILPPPNSDLAHQSLKDPYVFDFLTVGQDALEREIEKELTTHITKFLLELGTGFAFVGRQVPLTVGESDYIIDMLFYHIKLKCYVVIELKARKFDPRDAGQLNFYLSAVDDKIKGNDDNATIGILLCKSKDKVAAEYALRNLSSPIGISQYQLTKMMPQNLKTSLPTIEEIENELSEDLKKS